MQLYHPCLIKSTAILLLATLLLISHSLQLQLSHMMKIPPLWKEVMLPKALKKSTVHSATHTLNMDGNNPSSFHHSLPILPIQLPTALNHYPPSVFCNVTTDSNFFRNWHNLHYLWLNIVSCILWISGWFYVSCGTWVDLKSMLKCCAAELVWIDGNARCHWNAVLQISPLVLCDKWIWWPWSVDLTPLERNSSQASGRKKSWCHYGFQRLLKSKFQQPCHASRGLSNWTKCYSTPKFVLGSSSTEKTSACGKGEACDAWTEQVCEPHLNNTHTHFKTLTHLHPLYVHSASSLGFSRY